MKIFFDRIVIDNFLSIGHADIVLKEEGITLISGRNLYDGLSCSNGSGKSSVFEAILWNLTGMTSRGSANVSNILTEKSAYTELHFLADESSYVIKRKANPSALQILKDGEDISGNTFTKSKKVLADVLGFVNYDMLSSIIILTQGLGGRLSSLKASERKARLEMFSNMQELLENVSYEVSEVTNRVADEYLEVSKEICRAEAAIKHNRGLIASYAGKIQEVTENQEKVLSPAELDELNKEIGICEDHLAKTNGLLAQEISARSQLQATQKALQRDLAFCSAQIQKIKSDYLKIANNICPTCGQHIDNPALLSSYDLKLAEYSQKAEETSRQLESCNSQLSIDSTSILTKDIEDLSAKLAEARQLALDSAKYSSSVDTWNQIISSLTEDIASLEKCVFPQKSKLSQLDKDVQIAKWYKQAISRKFRNFLLDNVLGFLNKRLAHYSRYLFSSRTVHLESDGSNLAILLDSLEFENLSGGEGRRVDLLIQLALRDLAMNQSGFYCNLLVMDEVFDYLDDTGINNFMLMLDKESSFSESLMVITHRTGIEIPVARRLEVTKGENGVSSVKTISQPL